MGRDKAKEVRAFAQEQGWLEPSSPLTEDSELAEVFGTTQRPSTPSTAEPHREQVETWRREGLQVTTIFRLLRRVHHFGGSYSAVRRFVSKLEPEPSQRTMRLEFEPAEAAQVDCDSGPKLPDLVTGEPTWVLIMTPCWSRHQYAEIVWDQKVPTWLGCYQRAFRFFGGMPKRVIIDNPKCAITKACVRSRGAASLRRARRGLDQVALQEEAFDRLADVYTGSGRFDRDRVDADSQGFSTRGFWGG